MTSQEVAEKLEKSTLETFGIKCSIKMHSADSFVMTLYSEESAKKMFSVLSKQYTTKLLKREQDTDYYITCRKG